MYDRDYICEEHKAINLTKYEGEWANKVAKVNKYVQICNTLQWFFLP